MGFFSKGYNGIFLYILISMKIQTLYLQEKHSKEKFSYIHWIKVRETIGSADRLGAKHLIYSWILWLGAIFIHRKDIGVGGWSRKWQFSLTLWCENILTYSRILNRRPCVFYSGPYTANVHRQTTDKLMFKSVISTVRWIRK